MLHHHMQLRQAVLHTTHSQHGGRGYKRGACRADSTTTTATAEPDAVTASSSSSSLEGPSSSSGNGLPPVDPIRQAYLDGYKAGYAAGAKVTVNVSLSPRSYGNSSSSSSSSGQGAVPQQGQERERGSVGSSASASTSAAGSSTQQPPRQEGAAGQAPDSVVRSAVKALVWRLFSTALTVSVALLVLHDSLQVEDALKFGGIEFAAKFVSYFCYERLWIWLPKVL